MTSTLRALLAAGILLGPVYGCSADMSRETQPKLASEGECIAAPNRSRCRLLHDLAGGYPFSLEQSGR